MASRRLEGVWDSGIEKGAAVEACHRQNLVAAIQLGFSKGVTT